MIVEVRNHWPWNDDNTQLSLTWYDRLYNTNIRKLDPKIQLSNPE
jgi:hypothetical protein